MRQIYIALPTIALAAIILCISIFKTAQVTYSFSPTPLPNANKTTSILNNYQLPKVGIFTPVHPAWPIKAVADRAQIALTIGSLRRSELLLRVADHRLATARKLFMDGKVHESVSTLTKAEKYLERAFNEQETARLAGKDTSGLITKLSLSANMHKQVIQELADSSPEEARAFIVTTGNYPQLILDKVQPLVLSSEKQIGESRILR